MRRSERLKHAVCPSNHRKWPWSSLLVVLTVVLASCDAARTPERRAAIVDAAVLRRVYGETYEGFNESVDTYVRLRLEEDGTGWFALYFVGGVTTRVSSVSWRDTEDVIHIWPQASDVFYMSLDASPFVAGSNSYLRVIARLYNGQAAYLLVPESRISMARNAIAQGWPSGRSVKMRPLPVINKTEPTATHP